MNRPAAELVSGDITFRPWQPADEPAVLNLLHGSLGDLGGKRTPDYWRWKHFRNPFGQSAIWIATDAQGAPVALRAFLHWQFMLNSLSFTAYRCVDTAVHPDYRGRGLFTGLTLRVLEDLSAGEPAVVFNTPNARSMPGYLKMGWEQAGRLPLLIWPQPGQLILNRFRKPDHSEIHEFCLPADIRDRLTDYRLLTGNLITTSYSPEYLHWRYADVPGMNYHTTIETGNGFALAIWRLKSTRGLRELRLVELIHDDTGEAVQRLIRRLAREVRPDVVSLVTDGTGNLTRLLPSGFLPATRLGLTLTVRKINDTELFHEFSNLGQWNLSAGTMELF